jgi:hypothetical protein
MTRSAGGKKFKARIRIQPKTKPVLHRVASKPDPIAGRREQIEAADVLTRLVAERRR